LGGETSTRTCSRRSVSPLDHLNSRFLTIIRKIENFIRTKYDTKRWVMDGGIPDPATLDEDAEDDVVRDDLVTGCDMDTHTSSP